MGIPYQFFRWSRRVTIHPIPKVVERESSYKIENLNLDGYLLKVIGMKKFCCCAWDGELCVIENELGAPVIGSQGGCHMYS